MGSGVFCRPSGLRCVTAGSGVCGLVVCLCGPQLESESFEKLNAEIRQKKHEFAGGNGTIREGEYRDLAG